MEILRFEESKAPSAPKKRGLKSAFGISIVAGLFAVGSTFAATSSITVNGGAPIEFGQGVQNLTTCDGGITISVGQYYDATGVDDPVASPSPTPDFYLNQISFTNVDLDSNTYEGKTYPGCLGKFFRIRTYDSDGQLSGGTNIGASIPANDAASTYPQLSFSICKNTGDDTTPVFDCSQKVPAGKVFALTVESKDDNS